MMMMPFWVKTYLAVKQSNKCCKALTAASMRSAEGDDDSDDQEEEGEGSGAHARSRVFEMALNEVKATNTVRMYVEVSPISGQALKNFKKKTRFSKISAPTKKKP